MMFAHPRAGSLRTISTIGEHVQAFCPKPLPPDPPLQLNAEDLECMDRANHALGRLDGLGQLLPDTHLFVYFYVRKEAVVSSQIEGTQSSLSDLLAHESDHTPGALQDDVAEVSTYVSAVQYGLKRLRGGFPISLRLIREVHEVLLSNGRGAGKMPGEFRTSQNWIGGARPGLATFVPPPPQELMTCLGNLELFLHGRPEKVPILLRAALAHAQFETIHPFLDGNGRLGRLLITLLLCSEGVLEEPTLYLSLYLKAHRKAYYDHLQAVRTEGAWEAWVRFFLQGIVETAEQAVSSARRILELFRTDRARLAELGRKANAPLRLHEVLQRKPILSIADLSRAAEQSVPTSTKAILQLQDLGIVRELTGRQRGRLFVYQPYLDILNEGTTSPPG